MKTDSGSAVYAVGPALRALAPALKWFLETRISYPRAELTVEEGEKGE